MPEKKKKKKKRRTHLVPPLRLIGVCCIKLLMLRPRPVKPPRLSRKRFFCLALVLLYYDVGFPEFPYHPSVLNKKAEFVSER